ncbi:MAG: hypothetical protein VB817_09085, partial [Pirellulaceae bacterium]
MDSRSPTEEELLSSIQLSLVKGIGPCRFAELVSHYGSACQVLECSHGRRTDLPGVPPDQVRFLHSPENRDQAAEILAYCHSSKI